MCTLTGIFRFGGAPCNEEDLRAMRNGLHMLRSRGPDDMFIDQVDDNCLLGGNRLTIRNSEDGAMPFRSEGVVANFNGEIYGSPYGHELDGMAIIPAFLEHGNLFARCLDGEFSIALWHERESKLLLVRDHFGTKPLYFGFDRDRLVWGSSASWIAAVLGRPVCASVQGPAYRHTYWPQEPYTSFAGVWTVPPGHSLTVRASKLVVEPSPGWPLPQNGKKSVEEVLWDSLSTRLRNLDGKIAIPMSAGIDSGIIAFAAKALALDCHVFSLIEIFGQRTAEAEFILRRLDKLGHDQVTLLSLNETELDEALRTMFRPGGFDSLTLDNGAILTHRVARAIADEGIRVMTDGAGGDELFDGYLFRQDLASPVGWPRLPRDYLASVFSTLPAYTAKADRCGGFFSLEVRFPLQTPNLLAAAAAGPHEPGKGALRRFLLESLAYGEPLAPDRCGKYGFSMRGHDLAVVRGRMLASWEHENGPVQEGVAQPKFPFSIGRRTERTI